MIEDILEKALEDQKEKRAKYFSQLMLNPAESCKDLVQILHSPKKYLWPIAIQAIRYIGFPTNSVTILDLVEQLCNGNWPGWKDAIETLMDIDKQFVVPFLIEILLDRNRKRTYWSDDVENVCLAISHMKDEYIKCCAPSIIYVLSMEIEDEPDPEFIMKPLFRIDISQYPYALPVLIGIFKRAKRSEVKDDASKLLKSYSSDSINIYKLYIDE